MKYVWHMRGWPRSMAHGPPPVAGGLNLEGSVRFLHVTSPHRARNAVGPVQKPLYASPSLLRFSDAFASRTRRALSRQKVCRNRRLGYNLHPSSTASLCFDGHASQTPHTQPVVACLRPCALSPSCLPSSMPFSSPNWARRPVPATDNSRLQTSRPAPHDHSLSRRAMDP